MFKILVAGDIAKSVDDAAQVIEFTKALGAGIVRQSHVLLSGCRSHLDQVVAEAAHDALIEHGDDPKTRLISYVLEEAVPVDATLRN